jgi:hypothetical protein
MSEGVDVDDFLDDYVEGQRGDLMQAYRSLHEQMEQSVDAIGTVDELEELERTIERLEKVEHVLMEVRAIAKLRRALDEVS